MKEIKFRDYDCEKEEMRYFNLDQYDREEHNSYGNIMQYTGLKECIGYYVPELSFKIQPCYGLKLFSGDILKSKAEHHEVNGFILHEIKWDNEKAGWNINQDIIDTYELRLIGNIYQNPKLLEVQA